MRKEENTQTKSKRKMHSENRRKQNYVERHTIMPMKIEFKCYYISVSLYRLMLRILRMKHATENTINKHNTLYDIHIEKLFMILA